MQLLDAAADTGDRSAARRHPDERAQRVNSAVAFPVRGKIVVQRDEGCRL